MNYNESSEEDENDYNSPLVSPSRPPVTRAGSPVELAVPTLNDNVDEELEAVRQTLNNVGHTHTFRGTRPVPGDRPEPEGNEQSQPEAEPLVEEVVTGHLSVSAQPKEVCAGNEQPSDSSSEDEASMADFEDENGQDGAQVGEHLRQLQVPYSEDIMFFFAQLENQCEMTDIKSQWMKRQALVKSLPVKVQEEVKSLLILKKSEAGENPYKDLKVELIKIFGPRPEEAYETACARVMVSTPSQLGKKLVGDLCKKTKKLQGCCCDRIVWGMLRKQLPVAVRNHCSGMEFNHATYATVLDRADEVYLSNKMSDTRVSAVSTAASGSGGASSGGAEVAAVVTKPKKKKNKNKNSNGGGNNQNNNQSSAPASSTSSSGAQPSRGPRHESNPPVQACNLHWKHGPGAWMCGSPFTCPMRNQTTPRPTFNN